MNSFYIWDESIYIMAAYLEAIEKLKLKYKDILSDTDIQDIISQPEVIAAEKELDSWKIIYFNVRLPDYIKTKVHTRLGLDLFSMDYIPMSWIKGDKTPEIRYHMIEMLIHGKSLIDKYYSDIESDSD